MAIAYKSYFAFLTRPLKTSSGEPTSAVYGFLNQLFKIIEEIKPDYLAVATDSKEKTFRHEMYSLYKSSRSEMPEDMVPQIHRIFEIIEAFGIPLFKIPGYEADDLIGTAVKNLAEKGFDCYAVSPDKDYVQLIDSKIQLVKPAKTGDSFQYYNSDLAKEEYGFSPEFMADFLALVGDNSDDIPGVAGIGPKTAVPLIQTFGSIENLYDQIDQIDKASIREKLLASKENAFLSKKLATIITNCPIDLNPDELKLTIPNFDKLNRLFAELEFKQFGGKLLKLFSLSSDELDSQPGLAIKPDYFNNQKVKYTLINNYESAAHLANYLAGFDKIVFDTETDSLDVFTTNVAGVAFCVKPSEAFFVALSKSDPDNSLFVKECNDRLTTKQFAELFTPVLTDKKITKICHNAKFDIAVLRRLNIITDGNIFDTMVAAYLINSDDKIGMDALSLKYLNYQPIPITEIIGLKKDPSIIFEVDLNKLSDYSCEDADITYRLYNIFMPLLKDNNLYNLAGRIEFPLIRVLENMERTGINIDVNYLKNFSSELQSLLTDYTKKIYLSARSEFNINSTKQLQQILFENLRLQPTKKTKTGFSTDAQSLENMVNEHEIIPLLINYRQVQKLKSTYTDALPELINKNTGRLHTSFNQTVTSTGRLSSTNPNLQNIPIRTELGKEIRKAFIAADKNYCILSADYSQIELRIMAGICKDPGLVKAFNEGKDIHQSTAAQVFMVPLEEVTSDMRRKAKEVNFGILYGIGAFGLSTRLGIPQGHAKEIIETYFKKFTNVKEFIENSIEKARTNGYAETLLGRRRYLPNINSKNRAVRQFEERVATNMPIQGTAADLIKIAMIEINEAIELKGFRSRMLLQVHDELVFDVHKEELKEFQQMVIEKMESAMDINVPLKVECGIGENWLDAH